jgi:protein-tyrosine phosphatase
MEQVKVLNGGTVEWCAFNELSQEPVTREPGNVTLKEADADLLAEWTDVYDDVVSRRDADVVLLDARPHAMYTGAVIRHSISGGHIPGAVNLVSLDGTDAVISMTPSDELAKLEVAALPDAVAAAGMRWFHCPFEDDAGPGPAFEQAWAANRDAVMAIVSQQGSIAIHCRGGSGRTGFMAALILRAAGMNGPRADTQVLRLRPRALTLPAHTDYLAARDGQQPQQEQSK